MTEESESLDLDYTIDEEEVTDIPEVYEKAFTDLLNGKIIDASTKKPITEYSDRIDNFRTSVYSDNPFNRSLIIDFKHIKYLDTYVSKTCKEEIDFSNTLSVKLKTSPYKTLKEMVNILEEIILKRADLGIEVLNHRPFYIRIKNVSPSQKGMAELKSSNMEKLVEIRGMVLQSVQTESVLKEGHWKCKNRECGKEFTITQPYPFQYVAPPYCNNEKCKGKKQPLMLDIENSKFVGLQQITIEEESSNLEEGKSPKSITAYAIDDIVDIANPGSTVRVTGILKGTPKISLLKDCYKNPTFEQNLLISHIEVSNDEEIIEETKYTEEDFEAFAKKENAWEIMISRVGSGLKGLKMEKIGALLALFSGITRYNSDKTKRKRGYINVLYVGEPATGKSTLIKSVKPLCKKYQYASGKGITAAGLTAALIKNKEGVYELVAGTTVMADNGIAAIDEFDKIKQEDTGILHEQMESQVVGINKGGFHKTLNARADILAAANPVNGRYDWKTNFAKNVRDIPLTLISRFDLIFLLIEVDRRIPIEEQREIDSERAKFSLGLPTKEKIEKEITTDDIAFLREYIQYARKKANKHGIKLPEKVLTHLYNFYMEMREGVYGSEDVPIPIDNRYLDTLDRLTTARAKAMLRSTATIEDAEIATNLLRYSLKQLSPSEGETTDVTMLTTGVHTDDRKRQKLQLEFLYSELEKPENSHGLPISEFKEILIANELYKKTKRRTPEKAVDDEIKALIGGPLQLVDDTYLQMTREGYNIINKKPLSLHFKKKEELKKPDSVSDDEIDSFMEDFSK